jgi:hypothetical protein
MVQFKLSTYNAYRTKLGEANQYWKLGESRDLSVQVLKERLKFKAYYFTNKATKARLLHLLSRGERGLFIYEKYAVAELKRFCANRQIRLPEVERKANLIGHLEREDENGTFTRLLDLPPELRNRIYTLHFEGFEPMLRPIPPPIACVSRQMRQETLLLFYQTSTPIIAFYNAENPSQNQGLRISKTIRIHPDRPTWTLFRTTPQDYLANIRKFQLTTVVCTPTSWFETSWNVDLGNGSKQVRLMDGKPKCHVMDLPDGHKEAQVKLEKRLKAELKSIMARDGHNKLRRNDLEKFSKLFELQDQG